MSDSKSNLEIYDSVRTVPESALKTIEAGRLKGKSDINPMWRIKKLTETFGPAGFGWYTEITGKWSEVCESGEVAVFVEINLYVNRNGEWSRPICGTGGNRLVSVEKKWNATGDPKDSLYLDDDAYKKAYTDAISVAAKALGIGADVYWKADDGKYVQEEKEQARQDSASVPPRTGGIVLSPASRNWKAAVAFTASLPDSVESITEMVRSKYTISDADLVSLLRQAGKK